jgi:threonine aldolase
MDLPMRFFSDNAAAGLPAVLAALGRLNQLDTAYDGDKWRSRSTALLGPVRHRGPGLVGADRHLGQQPRARGAVPALWRRWSATAMRISRIDECGAPEFYTHGAKLLLGEGDGAKLTPDTIRAVIDPIRPDVHQVQPHAISITNATEYGLAYTPDEVAAIGALAGTASSGCTWTARASPMPWRISAAIRAT